jgi:hypothetical protein
LKNIAKIGKKQEQKCSNELKRSKSKEQKQSGDRKGKRRKAMNRGKVEAKKGDRGAHQVKTADPEFTAKVPAPGQNGTVPSKERLGYLIPSN